ncbi:hypothetical protein MXD63_30230 [Frankia sp. Cpl3]|uniref:hypothetical protein n=1 Tax=Parafrankia colletiae TaxID=573497 RepID=UPI000E2F7155|nr:hypothetical protein [Parafrankia colletiae]MCK9904312.1 hypothetical protein [Frankia sp. Cpl3]
MRTALLCAAVAVTLAAAGVAALLRNHGIPAPPSSPASPASEVSEASPAPGAPAGARTSDELQPTTRCPPVPGRARR